MEYNSMMNRTRTKKNDGRMPTLSGLSIGGSKFTLPNGDKVTLMQLMELLKVILPSQDLTHNVTLYRKCFIANHAIDLFKEHIAECENDLEALAFGRSLQQARIITHSCDDTKPFQVGGYYFRLQCYQQPHIINSYRIVSDVYKGDPMALVDGLSVLLLQLEKEALTGKHLVDYKKASNSKTFPFFESLAANLQGLDLGTLNKCTRFAVAVNTYNIMVKYGFMKVGVPVTKSTRSQFFSEMKVKFGRGVMLSLNDLEHGVIRANRPPPGISSAPFSSDDPRLRLALPKLDCRLHFCLDRSLGPSTRISVRPTTISNNLHEAGVRFLSQDCNLSTNNGEVRLNKIFKWYSSDFKAQDWRALLSLLETYVGENSDIQQMLKKSKPPTISYMKFDWGIEANHFETFTGANIKPNEKWVWS